MVREEEGIRISIGIAHNVEYPEKRCVGQHLSNDLPHSDLFQALVTRESDFTVCQWYVADFRAKAEQRVVSERVQVLFVAVEEDVVAVAVDRLVVVTTEEQREEDGHKDDLNEVRVRSAKSRVCRSYLHGLGQENRGEESRDGRCQPFLGFRVAEFDATNDDEEGGDKEHERGERVGDEDAPPWQRQFSLLSLRSSLVVSHSLRLSVVGQWRGQSATHLIHVR